MTNKPMVVFDIDGTLSDCSHRVALAQAKQWDEFHLKASQDAVICPIANLMRLVAGKYSVVLLTGRNERYRHITIQWLENAGLDGFYEALLMRSDDDFSKDALFKISSLEKYLSGQENVLDMIEFVVEDRDTVVEAMRNYGLTVLQPAVGGY